ncbi:hypothetical protein PVMG_05013 [Plasmodium vivax Mauritania I]|uniref:Armadillo repeat protein n=1 Tax=Plasmodium vivax Mauritania I TaxID=1035515 RepID=A0A0J9TE48_PLAVI|nr:hypothetical protein PVMG_05013 [Plasmodium vivax Mauritania I]
MASAEGCSPNVAAANPVAAREAYLASSRENDALREKAIAWQGGNEEEERQEQSKSPIERKKNVSIIHIHKFINKLKNASAANLEQSYLQTLLEDIKHLNISKYLSEILNCVLNLIHHVRRYSDLFLFVSFIRYVCVNYEHVSEHIDRAIFAKYFRLDEEDKNYFFLVFYELYNNVSESSLSANYAFCQSPLARGVCSGGEYEGANEGVNAAANVPANVPTNVAANVGATSLASDGPSASAKGDGLARQLKELWAFQKAKATAVKNLHTHLRKEGREADSFLLEHDLFSNEGKETKGWKSNLADQKAYIKEMLNDPNLLKKIKKKNKKRRLLLCMYLELVLHNICKNRDLLTYMFMNISFFFTLILDAQVTDRERIGLTAPPQEKRDVSLYATRLDVMREVKKHLAVSTVVTYDYVFANAGTLFGGGSGRAVDGSGKAVDGSGRAVDGCGSTGGGTVSNAPSKGITANAANTTNAANHANAANEANPALRLGEVKSHVVNLLRVFHHSSMANLLVYLYGEHLINEYSSGRKKSPCQTEDYNFFSVYDRCEKLCCFLGLEVPSLDAIQVVGIDLLGMKDASVNHIKLFDKMKNNSRKDKDGPGDETICFWANEEEKAFYTKFPDYSSINIALHEDEEGEEDTGIAPTNAATPTNAAAPTNAATPTNAANHATPANAANAGGPEAPARRDPKKGFPRYLEKLLHMNSEKELEDQVMTFLLNYNTKRKRKLVASSITHINQVVLNLIPFYCRYVAIINVYRKDMALAVLEEVKRITEKLIKEKLPCQNKKTKCIKYLCELAKFKLLDITYILDVLHLLNENFTPDHAELSLYILESCSLLLINNSKTHIRFINMLQKIKKMKSSRNLSTSFDLLFEECCIKIEQEFDPNKKNLKKKKTKSKYTEENQKKKNFLKKLLFHDIEEVPVEEISTHMRKFNWDDLFFTCLFRKYIFKFLAYMSIYQIGSLASLLFYIAMHRPCFVTQVIDELYERIVHIIERNDFKRFNLLIQYAHLFSELFIYRMLSSSSVLDLLYFLVALSDADMANSHHVASIHRLFHENRREALAWRGSSAGSQPGRGGTFEGATFEGATLERATFEDAAFRDTPFGEAAFQDAAFHGDHFPRGDYANPLHKLLLINKRSPVFLNLLQDPDCSSFINIKMICIIVERCGKYFQNAPLLKFKLTKFFLIFARFLRVQEPLPVYVTDLTNNVFDMFCRDMRALATVRQVDKYLLRLLACEYRVYLSTNPPCGITGGGASHGGDSPPLVTEEELTFRLDAEDAAEQHNDAGREKLKGNTRRGGSGPQAKTGQYAHGGAYWDGYGGGYQDRYAGGYQDRYAGGYQDRYAGTRVRGTTAEDGVPKEKDQRGSHPNQEDATADEDIDEEINAIIKSSILENRSCQSRRAAPQNIKNATLYGKLLGRAGIPVGAKCAK